MTNRLIPVTILTGFLGSGKTTLLNYILKQPHGHRIAVIENEFGEAGIDNELLVQDQGEQIIEMNNGCICCTVRGDLVRILGELAAKHQSDVMNQTIREPAVLNNHVVCRDDAGASSHLSSRFVSRTLATLSSLNVLTN